MILLGTIRMNRDVRDYLLIKPSAFLKYEIRTCNKMRHCLRYLETLSKPMIQLRGRRFIFSVGFISGWEQLWLSNEFKKKPVVNFV